jgi:hypothetical protein
MHEAGINMTQAISRVMQDLKHCCARFDQAAAALRKRAAAFDAHVRSDVESTIECFETLQTGGHTWSFACNRYGVGGYRQQDGSLSIPL